MPAPLMMNASMTNHRLDSTHHTYSYYIQCMIGGAVSCGLSRLLVTPLDVVKCNMQVSPNKYTSLAKGMRTILQDEGMRGLWRGWTPAVIGYGTQGLLKFGLYEIFKDSFSTLAGEDKAQQYKGWIYLAGAASAEFFADIALCPMEMMKVKLQTSPPNTFPTSLLSAWKEMRIRASETRFPFGSLVPLWSRNVPYTMVNFYAFENIIDTFYAQVFTNPRDSYDKSTRLGITLMSGYISGVICAIVSHPADSIISLRSQGINRGKSINTIVIETGFIRLMTKGLGTRTFMLGTLTGVQWWIYDSLKIVLGSGIPPSIVSKRSEISHDILNTTNGILF